MRILDVVSSQQYKTGQDINRCNDNILSRIKRIAMPLFLVYLSCCLPVAQGTIMPLEDDDCIARCIRETPTGSWLQLTCISTCSLSGWWFVTILGDILRGGGCF